MNEKIGLGCPDYDERIFRLATRSPRAAWAELTGAIKAPFTPSVKAIFESSTQEVASGDMNTTVMGADTFVTGVVFDIQVPGNFSGNVWKSLQDFFYNKTSGILCKLNVTGAPRYTVTPDFTPLSNLLDFVPFKQFPEGWLITREQGLHMDFTPQSPLPSGVGPITITATFQGLQYVCADIDRMPLSQVYENLKSVGYDVTQLRQFNTFR